MGVNKPLTFLLPLYCFFSGKFMIISYFFGVFRVFSPVNFLYAQPIVFLRSYAQTVPANCHVSQKTPAFCTGNVRNTGVICIYKKAQKTDFSIFRAASFLINL